MDNKFSENFKEKLLNIPTARLVSGGKEVLMRCRYCQDSRDPKSAHMYISIPVNGNLSFHNCFKCHTKGIVTHEKLIQWGIYDPSILVDIGIYNKESLKLDKNRKFKDKDVYKINNSFISQNELSEAKLRYINRRLGLSLDYSDLLSKKVILNLNDLLSTNKIDKLTRDRRIIEQLDTSFIGFISYDNAFINMRNLTPGKVDKSIDRRYINYNIFEKFDNTQRYYTLPTNIDLYNPERIKIHIAEGPFDILSIYYNLRKDDNNCIYSSILGSGYINIIKHFINTLKLVNIEIHIYIDADVSYYVINEIKEICYVFQIPFYLHRNMMQGEKDFGVSIDKINEQIERVM
ncbi:MAG: hypothetical protein ACRDD7_16705 [Peptostreptococcaceae bacterium]